MTGHSSFDGVDGELSDELAEHEPGFDLSIDLAGLHWLDGRTSRRELPGAELEKSGGFA
jgi:hypothetical protein